MREDAANEIDQRLERLQASLLRWKLLVAALCLLVVATIGAEIHTIIVLSRASRSMPQFSSGQVVAREFVAVDKRGKPVAAFGSFLGSGSLLVLSAEAKQTAFPKRIPFGKFEDLHLSAPNITSLMHKMSTAGGIALVAAPGEESVNLSAKQNLAGLELSASPDSSGASLSAFTRKGPSFSLTANGPSKLGEDVVPASASLTLFGSRRVKRAFPPETTLTLSSDGSSHLELDDANDDTRAIFGSADLEYRKTGATEETGLSSITLYDKKGNLIWKAPR